MTIYIVMFPGAASCIDFNAETRKLFVGLENGTICVSNINLYCQIYIYILM